MGVETRAKDREELKEQLLKQEALHQQQQREMKSKRNQVAPTLYTHKVAHKKALEKQKERIENLQLKLQTDTKLDIDDGDNHEVKVDTGKSSRSIFGILYRGLTKCQNIVHKNLNLIQLLTPMLLQDGPFLIVRLVLVSYYKVTGIFTSVAEIC